jgi:hypothetical protein
VRFEIAPQPETLRRVDIELEQRRVDVEQLQLAQVDSVQGGNTAS